MYKVEYQIKQGERMEKTFDSLYLCRKFVNQLRLIKDCIIISRPLFD